MGAPVLTVRDLRVHFATEDGLVKAVDGVSFDVQARQLLGLVGESGCGKSVTALTMLGLTGAPNARIEGQALLGGRDLLALPDSELRDVRGNDVAMIFQDPMSSLHPFFTVGHQLSEAVRAHEPVSGRQARQRSVELLRLVGIPAPERRVDAYPHEFSGGMRQRVMIAMALINRPKLLVADEPTTALDVTVQAQILRLIARLQDEFDTAVILISHDIGVVARTADHVAVMYAGRIVEHAPTAALFREPQHPYTWGLLRSVPRLTAPRELELEPIAGSPPSLIHTPSGCSFHPRCPYVLPRHREVDPSLLPVDGDDHEVACLLSASTRRRLWSELSRGQRSQAARRAVELKERG